MSNRTMRKFKIGNHWVRFPFVPYEPQERFIEKMISSIENEQNALLESPTGTGKTACLICGSLAWLDSIQLKQEETHMSDGSYKIFFCSRTHSQLRQAMQEFQNSPYTHMKVAVLSSRKHLCLHPSAKKDESKLDIKCKALRRPKSCKGSVQDIEDLLKPCTQCNPSHEHQCPYYKNFEDRKRRNDFDVFTQCGPLDQVKLTEKCKQYEVCPFYVSRHLVKNADMTFLPYSYLFNPNILRVMNLQLENSVLIIDEGHNIERVCEENASFEMRSSDVGACHDELTHAETFRGKTKSRDSHDSSDFPDVSLQDVMELKNIVWKLESKLETEIEPGKPYPGDYLLKQFQDAGFSKANRQRLLGTLDSLIKFCGDQDCKVDGMKKVHSVTNSLYFLDRSKSYSESESDSDSDGDSDSHASSLEESFVLYKEKPNYKEKLNEKDKKVVPKPKIHFWCFDAGVIMKALERKKVRSFIITSGTLSPLAPLRDSLGISFAVDLINDHVIDSFQVQGLSIRNAPIYKKSKSKNVLERSEVTLNSSYKNREMYGDDYYAALGRVVLEVVSASPNGVLIFFTSSDIKEQCLKRWDQVDFKTNDNSRKTLLDAINSTKEIFLEPSQACNLNDLQKKFKLKVDNSGNHSGACLIGVMSGKVSEGIDFKDQYGRAVIMVGIPFLPIFDTWVSHKKAAVEKKRNSNGKKAWELAQAIRPVNQAIGRIIRHRLDFGVIILPDERYCAPGDIRGALPKWLKSNLKPIPFENIKPSLKEFFSSIESKIKETEVKAEKEKAKLCLKHEIELKNEEITSGEYFELIDQKRTGMARREQLEKQLDELRREMSETRNQLEKIRSIVYQETLHQNSILMEEKKKDSEVMEVEDISLKSIEERSIASQETLQHQNSILMEEKKKDSEVMEVEDISLRSIEEKENQASCNEDEGDDAKSEGYYDSDSGQSEWEELDRTE